jgi:hypothetical protein
MYKVCARCGGGAIHWASLGPFAVDTCYHISFFMIGFTASINTHRWLLGCPLAHLLLLHLALIALTLSVFAMLTAFLAYSMKAMARCSPLSKNAAANVANVENQDATGHPVETARIVSEGEAHGAPNNDGHALSARGTEDSMDGGASDDENSQTYYFGASTITLSKINKMVEMGYFVEGEARVTGRKRSRSLIMTKPLVMRTFSSLDYACLCILLWVASCYNCRQNFTS